MSVLRDAPRHFDPACPHERAHRALAEALAQQELAGQAVIVSGAGCGALVHAYLELPVVAAPFGRGPSVARGLRLTRPDCVPVVYAGEGELLGEGLADLVRASAGDEPMLVLMIDNAGGDEPLLEALGARTAEVADEEVGAVADALAWALRRASQEGRFALVRVRGACPQQTREAGCRR